jgi:hypothetical protein
LAGVMLDVAVVTHIKDHTVCGRVQAQVTC